MKDFLGKELSIGDEVVAIRLRYKALDKGKVVRFTDKMVILECEKHFRELKQFPQQIVKISHS